MNAALLEVGEYYAYSYYRGRGVYPTNCTKVKLIRSKKEKEYSSDKRKKTRVLLEHESGNTAWASVRDLVDRWEDYEGELEHIRQEQAAHRNEQLRKDIRQSIIETVITKNLVADGFPEPAKIRYDLLLGQLTLRYDSLTAQAFFKLSTTQLDELVEKAMENGTTV